MVYTDLRNQLSMIPHLSPILRVMYSKIESYQGKSDTPFVDGMHEIVEHLKDKISPELTAAIVSLMSQTTSESNMLRRAINRQS